MTSDLIIKEEYSGDVTRVIVSGEADIYTSSKLKDRL